MTYRHASPRFRLWMFLIGLGILLGESGPDAARGENWPRWRGPEGTGVSSERNLPWEWSDSDGVVWEYPFPGEGASSPIVWNDDVFLTSAEQHGGRRHLLCLDRRAGTLRWRHTVEDPRPEPTSALTGHAAATPVTDGEVVVCFFGNAGLVACDLEGNRLWHRVLGEFESELGFSSSPVLSGDLVLQVCDHDGDSRSSFPSFLVALDRLTGEERWRTARPGLYRSWSTPMVVPGPEGLQLIVNGQDELRSYDVATGELRWSWEGMTGWVTPSPLFDGTKILATSGRDGPLVALLPDPRNSRGEIEPIWHHPRGGPYVCSPLLHEGKLYAHDERGVLSCYDGGTGRRLDRQRLEGRFYASGVAGDGRIYISNDAGVTYVLRPGPASPEIIARNDLREEILASPAISQGALWIRTRTRLLCIARDRE